MASSTSRGAVLVTGASTGIGRACAESLDGIGFTVLAGVRKDSDADSLRRAGSERMRPVLLDVTDASLPQAELQSLAEEAHEKICPYSHATRGNVGVAFEVVGG